MARIFISYRRQDSDIWVSRLVEELRKHFSADQVFQDVASIDPGADFVDALDKALGAAAVMLAVIGPGWLSATDKQGRRRLDLPGDFVRQEVAESLRRPGVRVFPLLVGGTEMPSEEELPEPLKALHRRQAFELTVRHWANDIAQLVQTLKQVPGLADGRGVNETTTEEQDRVLDAALPKRVTVGSAAELMAMIRLSASGGLRAVLQLEEELDLSAEDVKSQPFKMEFPLDDTGRHAPVNVSLTIDAPQFEPISQTKVLRVPPDGDSEICRFLIVPKQAGQLKVMLEAKIGKVYQAARVLRTTAETVTVPQPVAMCVVSVPLFTVSRPTSQQAGLEARHEPAHEAQREAKNEMARRKSSEEVRLKRDSTTPGSGQHALPLSKVGWARAGVAAAVAGAVLFVVSLGREEPSEPSAVAPPPVSVLPVPGERESVRRLILSTTQSAKMLCREIKTLELKKAGKQHAEQIGNSALADQFAGQVSELTRNIESLRREYIAMMSTLQDADRSVVKAEFDNQMRGAGAATTDLLYVQAVRDSYEKQLRGENPLSQDCLVDAR